MSTPGSPDAPGASLIRIKSDPDVLEAFYREHLPMARAYVARRVDDPHTAADLTADIFLRAIGAAGRYRADLGPPAAWLTGIARKVVADHGRRRARESVAMRRIGARPRSTTNRPTASSSASTPRRAPRAAVAAAALAIVGAAGAVVLTPSPAYAVSKDSSGRVFVEVTRLEGPRALESALAELGVAADITYLDPGMACAPGRYRDATSRGSRLTVGSDYFAVVLPPGAVDADQTFVMSASVRPRPRIDGFESSVDFGVADGPVGPCQPVPAAEASS